METAALQAALDDCNEGGTVVFDADRVYLAASLMATGTVSIVLPINSTLRASTQVGCFPRVVRWSNFGAVVTHMGQVSHTQGLHVYGDEVCALTQY